MMPRTRTGAHRILGFAALSAFCVSVSPWASAQTTPPTPAASPAPDQTPASAPVNGDALPAPAEAAPAASAVPNASGTANATAELPAEVAPAAPPAPNAAEAAADAEAEALAAMQGTDPAATNQGDDFKLNFYGFADVNYSTFVTKNPFGETPPAFALGSFNLYMGSDLGDNWRMLGEVRFMYLPNGTVPYSSIVSLAPAARTDTTVPDYTTGNKPIQWGGISIQRMYFEHTFSSWFTARAGQFLTPYGIWNVDHGSPVIIGVRRPYAINETVFPAQQTGFEFYGSGIVGPVELGYHLTLSNGRGPVDSYLDFDHNKALGGRLFARHRSELGIITLGLSGYRGKYTDRASTTSVDSEGNLVFANPMVRGYDELALAADLKWERGGFLFQSEAMMNDYAYNDRVRPASYPKEGVPSGQLPDGRRGGFYGITGYRFEFLGVMPWVGGEWFGFGKQDYAPEAGAVMAGLNVRPSPRVVLKAQYSHVFLPNSESIGNPKLNILDLQGAWSF